VVSPSIMFAVIAAWAPLALLLGFLGVDPNSPLAVVIVGGIITGFFSVVNTFLNIRLIRVAAENRERLEQVKMVTDTVQVRKDDTPPFTPTIVSDRDRRRK
jgi:hypothetical protein